MKRILLAVLTLAILLLVNVQAYICNKADANPSPELDFPREPVRETPKIIVNSPVQKQDYNSTTIWLNFTIIKPQAWIQRSGFYGASDGKGNKIYDILGNITCVYYLVDGKRQNISVLDAPSLYDYNPKPLTLNFSINLNLVKGAHNVQVGFEADSYYINMADRWNGYITSIKVNGSSDPINFSILKGPFPDTFAVFVALTVIVVVGIFYNFRKRKYCLVKVS
jgi:hypothetical protein